MVNSKQPYIMKLSVHHDCWSNPTEKMQDVSLKVLGIGVDDKNAFGMIKTSGSKKEQKKLFAEVKKHPVTNTAAKQSEDSFYLNVVKDSSFHAHLAENYLVATNNVYIKNGVETHDIFGFSKKSLLDAVGKLKEEWEEVKVVSLEPYRRDTLLSKEKELLDIALKRGYYEIPRKAYLKDLADDLGLKKSIVSDRLRNIEKKIITKYLAYEF